MDLKWVAVENSKQFLDLIAMESVGLEEVKELYKKEKYDEAAYAYYRFSVEKFKRSNSVMADDISNNDIYDADMIMKNKVSMIGYDYFSISNPIDWNIYPDNDKQWQNHLSYMYFPKSLLKAYKKTGNKKYIDKWNEIHMSFIKNHPYGIDSLHYSKRVAMYKNEYLPVCGGEGFCSEFLGGSWISLATSRVECWIEGIIFMAHFDVLDISVLCNIVASVILEHLPVLFDNPRKGTPNQFIHTSNILINIGIAFWEAKLAAASYLIGMDRLEEAVGEYCILPDGTDLEQCSAYNSGLVDMFYEIYNNEYLKNNKRIDKLIKMVEKRCEYLALIKDPLGYTPAMSKRQNKDYDNSCLDIKKYMEMYPENDVIKNIYSALVHGKINEGIPMSVDFPYGGYSVMRNGWGKDAMYLFMKYSRHSPGHKHEDANSVVVTAYGRRLLIDSGNYNYSNDKESMMYNNYMHSSRAHNTMDFDGLSQARRYMDMCEKIDERYASDASNEEEYAKYLKIKELHENTCPGKRCHNEFFEMAEGIYADGYYDIEKEDNRVVGVHKRQVVHIKNVGYIIDDVIDACDENIHTFYQHWNLADDFLHEDIVIGNNYFVTKEKNKTNIGIWNFFDEELFYKMSYGEEEPVSGWSAKEYGHIKPSADITVSAKAKGKMHIISFIYPNKSDKFDVKAVKGKGIIEISVPDGIIIIENNEKIVFNGNEFKLK